MPDTSVKKRQRSINVNKNGDQWALDIVNEKDSPFASVSELYDVGAKVLWLLSKGNGLGKLATAVKSA